MGVKPGDRVVSYMPKWPETAIAMMATVAIGAVWSSAAIEFGVRTVVDRFAQIAPKVILSPTAIACRQNFSRDAEVRANHRRVAKSLEQIIWLPYLARIPSHPMGTRVTPLAELVTHPAIASDRFHFERVGTRSSCVGSYSRRERRPAESPSFIATSVCCSKHLKLNAFHIQSRSSFSDVFLSTTGWMM